MSSRIPDSPHNRSSSVDSLGSSILDSDFSYSPLSGQHERADSRQPGSGVFNVRSLRDETSEKVRRNLAEDLKDDGVHPDKELEGEPPTFSALKPRPITPKKVPESSTLGKVLHVSGVLLASGPLFVWLKPIPSSVITFLTYHLTSRPKNLERLNDFIRKATEPARGYIGRLFSIFERPDDLLTITYGKESCKIKEISLTQTNKV